MKSKSSSKSNIDIKKMKTYKVSSDKCAPCAAAALISKNGSIIKKKSKSCYSKESLIKIADAFSRKYPDKKIITTGKTPMQIWNEIRNRLSGVCANDEYCWKQQDFVKKLRNTEIELYTFKPRFPKEWIKNKYTWLNTYDILYVMKQYEKMNPDFMFNGVIPSDCPTKITCELSNLDIKKMIGSGIKKYGVVYNLDTSEQSGSHWTALYVEHDPKTKKAEIDFYDSYGSKPIPLIKKFIIDLKSKYEKVGFKPFLVYNDKRHQYGGSECGLYSMNFILERLHGGSMYDISKRDIPDKDMTYLRKVLYYLDDNTKKIIDKQIK